MTLNKFVDQIGLSLIPANNVAKVEQKSWKFLNFSHAFNSYIGLEQQTNWRHWNATT